MPGDLIPPPPRVVMASGVFALLHRGHINLLWRAKQLGDVLVVGVVSDSGTRAYKGSYPVENIQQRMRAIERLSFVDVVLLQPETDPTPLLERIRPDVLVHGDDWSELLSGQDTVERLGIEWVLLPYTQFTSTTELKKTGHSPCKMTKRAGHVRCGLPAGHPGPHEGGGVRWIDEDTKLEVSHG